MYRAIRVLIVMMLAFVPFMLFAENPNITVLWENNFPAIDSEVPTQSQLQSALPRAQFAGTQQIDAALANSRLLILPYGSAFPEENWSSILAFLNRGGNLLVLGGRPFSRAAYRDASGKWLLRPERKAFAKELLITDYVQTPGSQDLQFVRNDSFSYLNIPQFQWNKAYSAILHLSDEALYDRGGSAGAINARLDAFVWGVSKGNRLSAPITEIDHLNSRFAEGRWIFLACDVSSGFYGSPTGKQLLTTLVTRAQAGAEEFTARPTEALFLPGETPTFNIILRRNTASAQPLRIELEDAPETGAPSKQGFDLGAPPTLLMQQITIPASSAKGFHTVTAKLLDGSQIIAIYRTGYWIRDFAYLNSGPKLAVNRDFFELNGRTLPVVGSTYMASDTQRLFFMLPNPYVWDQDFAEMQRNGINMIRTGWWSAWDQVMRDPSNLNEHSLRSIEAFLMTARRHDIPLQFNLFAFIPDVFGGANPYLDPEAVRRESIFVTSVVSRFKDIPFLAWDLINEPSFDNPKHLWATRPNGDAFEATLWNQWLMKKYGSNGAAAAAWNITPPPAGAPLPIPSEADFDARGVYSGAHPLMAHDFYMFAQEEFVNWVREIRDAIRSTGSRQLITIGQDEGGGTDRLNTSYWGPEVDFTTNHSWWQDDALLWDSLVAKQPGEPMLIQETGLQNNFQMDASWRLSPQEQSNLLERKIAIALATSAGAIEWLWNLNSYMIEDQEVPIGIVRSDYTQKPDAVPMRELAAFADANRDAFKSPELPQVAIVTSQAFQYSAMNPVALQAQGKAVRVLNYDLGIPSYMIAENQLRKLGAPRLVIFPSPMALPDFTWNQLLAYVNDGGVLLVTGSMERDPAWVPTSRLKALGVDASLADLNFHSATLTLPDKSINVSYDNHAFLDALRFSDGSTYKDIPHGRGHLLVTSYPVELADGNDATAAAYRTALEIAGVRSPYELRKQVNGVLVRPTVFADSVLYLFNSETWTDQDIDMADRITGAHIQLRLPAGRSALALIDRKNGNIVSRYGF